VNRLRRAFKNRKARALGISGCLRCHDTWDWKPSHSTTYTATSGCFPLCEECWSGLTPDERLPYYALLAGMWIGEAQQYGRQDWVTEYVADWPAIEAAVLGGL